MGRGWIAALVSIYPKFQCLRDELFLHSVYWAPSQPHELSVLHPDCGMLRGENCRMSIAHQLFLKIRGNIQALTSPSLQVTPKARYKCPRHRVISVGMARDIITL